MRGIIQVVAAAASGALSIATWHPTNWVSNCKWTQVCHHQTRTSSISKIIIHRMVETSRHLSRVVRMAEVETITLLRTVPQRCRPDLMHLVKSQRASRLGCSARKTNWDNKCKHSSNKSYKFKTTKMAWRCSPAKASSFRIRRCLSIILLGKVWSIYSNWNEASKNWMEKLTTFKDPA